MLYIVYDLYDHLSDFIEAGTSFKGVVKLLLSSTPLSLKTSDSYLHALKRALRALPAYPITTNSPLCAQAV